MRQAYDKWLAGLYLFTRWTLVTLALSEIRMPPVSAVT
jgi:hypothetical protein